ncbi:MAG: cytochrome c family protein [Rhodospirillaceae bacterium]|nr:cytochrome c family protein [Rhodospirillaceae bacterium]
MKKISIVAATFIALALASGTAGAADAKKGKKVFNKCKACHTMKAGKNKVGPSLHGIMGRKAASVPKFKYSKAMKTSDLTWDEDTLRKFLAKPKKFLKGTRMSFAGIKKEKQMDNLMAYLKEASK